METYENGTEVDRLLEAVAERGEALKMPKPKLHWKQKKKLQQEKDRRKRASPYERAYRPRLEKSLRRRWYERKRLWEKRGERWELSFDEWVFAWICCPLVNGAPAWHASGLGKNAVRAERIDASLPWRKDNFQITHGKKVLFRYEEEV